MGYILLLTIYTDELTRCFAVSTGSSPTSSLEIKFYLFKFTYFVSIGPSYGGITF